MARDRVGPDSPLRVATLAEIMEVLKLCVAHGVHTCNLGVPILAEELRKRS